MMNYPQRRLTSRYSQNTPAARFARVLAALFAGCCAALCAAQSAQVELSVDSRDIFVDQPFGVDVVVDYSKEYAVPQFPDVADCDVKMVGTGPSSSMTTIINGQYSQRNTIRFRYALTPHRVGKFEIPAFTVTVDGRNVRTAARSFEARKDDSASLMTARVLCDANRLYVGQTARFTLEIWVKMPELARKSDRRLAGTMQLDGQSTWRWINARSLGPFKTVQNVRTETKRGGDAAALERWHVFSVVDMLTVSQPGPLQFPDLLVQMNYPLEVEVDPFGFSGGNVTRSRQLAVAPDYGNVEVLPLPTEGRPADFSGAVGHYAISTSITPAEARVGDPIELSIELRGDGGLDSLPPPRLETNRELTSAFRLPDAALTGETSVGVRRYKVTLRASKPVDELPAISYSYFDPSVGQYATAVAPSKPLRVRAAEKVDATEVVGLSAPTIDKPTAEATPLDGLQPNRTDEAELLTSSREIDLPQTLLVTLGPPLAFVGAIAARALRARRSGPAERRRNALYAASERIRAANGRPPRELAAEIHAALGSFLADRLNEPVGRYVGRAGVELLSRRGHSPPLVKQWEQIVETAEAASFGGLGGADASRLADDAQQVLAAALREGL